MLLTTKFWPDSEGRAWKLDLQSSEFQLLLVSQFTLYAKPYKKGRLDFHLAMSSEPARVMYSEIVSNFESILGPERVRQGEFGAMMQVNRSIPINILNMDRCR
jgi:D-aminoacyl-tRNA deacylase